MNETLREHFQAVRREHPGIKAKLAMEWAKELDGDHYAPVPADLTGSALYNKGISFKMKGFWVHASAESDQDYSSLENMGMGRWVEGHWDDDGEMVSDEPGALRRASWGRDEFQFYVPQYSFAERERDARAGGLSKQDAREDAAEGVKQELARAEGLGSEWHPIGIIVKVERAGVDLGESSIWGVEDDSKDEYFRQLIWEHAHEAIAEAQENLKALCECDD